MGPSRPPATGARPTPNLRLAPGRLRWYAPHRPRPMAASERRRGPGAGLVVWIVYLAKQADVLAWVASGLLLPVAVLGFSMLGRWVGSRRARLAVADLVTGAAPAESRLPLAAVVVHGLLALTTIVLVL